MRLLGLLSAQGKALARRLVSLPLRQLPNLRGRPLERLLIAPQDIRTSDPTIAADIYAGYFSFEGKIVNTHGRSPFEIEPLSPAWARALAGFGWLRHLRAADTALARANARALVDDFLTLQGKPRPGPAWEVRPAARRMLAWLSQSPIILENADRAFYRRFMKGLTRLQIFLERKLTEGIVGEDRLLAVIALAELGLCAEGANKVSARGTRLLTEELERQILPDGGHISRNPRILIDLLLDLLPLRQAYAARGFQTPAQLLNVIDRMMPMLRLFRHGDGTLALFNGMGVTAPELLATVLAYDDARAQALTNAPYSGYQRIEEQDTVFIMDVGRPPPQGFSQRAHAGCLSFEFSIGAHHLVVNCGSPEANRPLAREAARATAAHSTLVIDDSSSCRFTTNAGLWRWLGTEILSGPEKVEVKRQSRAEGVEIIASHDGYAPRFGWLHERRVTLSRDGRQLAGIDSLQPAVTEKAPEPRPFVLRFHIHPQVRVRRLLSGTGVLCLLPNGRRWLFEAKSVAIDLEESVFYALPDGPRKSAQIVVQDLAHEKLEIAWRFRRIERKPRGAGSAETMQMGEPQPGTENA
ncbi:heparinase II/III family protein [Beijerinckia indica]|uniref:Heparinase II/III family protein n=1 Tax=Beijerinckia indica subsp. indica (strain ATCC 9039 / DSM 1715 / NCIMB 8712) TaxID=395963 RepID=B2IFV2_BEII9|nr:heparinase II/III family protein [Beijerinckia indica]ACB95691.1 Heparinase II/III family protein [Beijerinckia indica subsp. indica ATCC 9039]